MMTQLKFLEKMDWFYYWRSNHLNRTDEINHTADMNKLENLISLESVGGVCYQSISHMIHNQRVRRECKRLEQKCELHGEELRKIFHFSSDNDINIEYKKSKYLLELEPSYLSFRSVMNLAISLSAYKVDTYKYFCHTVREHHEILKRFVEESVEEMSFVRNEKKTYIHEIWDTDLKISLD